MKAIRIHEDGGPEVLRYEDVPDPAPGSRTTSSSGCAPPRSTISTCGCERACLPCRSRGSSARTAQASSRRLGEGVEGFEPGQRVVINPGVMHDGRVTVIGEHTDGTHAELIAVPATNVYLAPRATSSFEEAAAFPLVFETAYRMLVTKAGAPRRRVGARVGHRRRRRDRGVPDREGARRDA